MFISIDSFSTPHEILLDDKKELKLILVAARSQLSRGDLRSLVDYLESDNCEFKISLQISDPTEQPELL